MAFARPFAYNTGSPIPGTEQVGNLAIGVPTSGFTNSPQFWNGPDEELGYVIAIPISGNTQPTPVSVTWDPNYVGTGIVLSSGNTVATLGQIQSSVLGTRLITSPNKVMYSIMVNQLVNGQIGFGLQDMDLNSYVGGFDAKSIGFSSDGDYLYAGTVQDSGLPTWGSVNDVVDIALDLNTGIWWIRVNGGNWNGTRNEDPSSGTGSVNSAALNNLYPAITPFPVNIQGQVTLLSQPIYSVPSGFNFLGETTSSVGFYRTETFDNTEFINLSEIVSNEYGDPQTFLTALDASTWLTSNGFWNSYSDVVINGLTLQLDASNNTSYPGSGNIWYDLVSPQQNITLVNSPTFTPTSPSYFSFNGTNQYGTGTGPVLSATTYTKSVWFYLNSYADNNLVSSETGGHFMYLAGTNKIYCGHTDWPSYGAFPSNFNFELNTWYYVALTFNTTDGMKLYVNGVLDSIYTANKSPLVGNLSTNVGVFGTGNLLNGRVGRVFCYNRSLSDAEVLQNFDGTKEPFIPVTPTPTPTNTITPTPSVTPTQTNTPTPSVTPTQTNTPTPSVTTTQTNTPTPSVTPTETNTPTPTNTASQTLTPTPTPTNTETLTPTPTETETPTPTPTNTETPTGTPSETPTNTPTPTSTDLSSVTTFTISGCTNLNVLVADLGPSSLAPGDVFNFTFTGGTPSGCYRIVEKTVATPTDGATPLLFYVNCAACEATLVTPTPTVTQTSTPTPSVTNTQTPSVTPTLTPTPSTSPVPVTGYSFNLVALPYNFPSSGNTIMNGAGGATSGTTDPNVLATGSRGIYWNSIDSDGIDRTDYFSGFTGQSITITMSQTGSTAIYSGDTNSLKTWTSSPNNGFVFGAGIGVPPVGTPSGTAVLIQSASTQWTLGLPVYISAVIN